MPRVDEDFNKRVYELVAQIPHGKIMTYGLVAAACGHAYAAWEVGQIAHYGPSDLPWHRVVNKQGGMASGFVPDGPAGQRKLLEAEGITFTTDDKIHNIATVTWQQSQTSLF